MLRNLIITAGICLIGCFFINGFTLYNFMLIIPTAMFCVRKIGIHLKLSNIVTAEVLFLVFSILWRLMFKKFYIGKLLLTILVRLIFLAVVVYDDSVYVYVSEERKKT